MERFKKLDRILAMALRLGGTLVWLGYIFLAGLEESLLAKLVIFDTTINFFAMFGTIGIMQSYKLSGANDATKLPQLSSQSLALMVMIVMASSFLTYYQFQSLEIVIVQLFCVTLVGYCLLHSSFHYGARRFVLGAILDSSSRYFFFVLLLLICDVFTVGYSIFHLYLGSCIIVALFLIYSFNSTSKGEVIKLNFAYFGLDSLNAIARYGYVIASTLVLSVTNAAVVRIAIDSATFILLPQQVYLGMLAGELAPKGSKELRFEKYQNLAVELSRFIPISIAGLLVICLSNHYSLIPDGISSLLSFPIIAAIFITRCITILAGPAIQAAIFTESATKLSIYSFTAVAISILFLLVSGSIYGIWGVAISICFGIIARYWVAIYILAGELSLSTCRMAISTAKQNFVLRNAPK